MKLLSDKEYQQLRQNARVLTDDIYGDKVLLLSDKTVLKLFRIKRLISSALFFSPAKLFVKNSKKLHQLNIPTITIVELYQIKSIKRSAVHYKQLQGQTIREFMQSINFSASTTDRNHFLSDLGTFIAHLHHMGIYFRSAHFGNIIYTNDKKFGLIDILDMKIHKKPLNKNKRLRNLKHIFRLDEDIDLVKDSQLIEQSYLDYCTIKDNKFQQDFLNKCRELKQL